MAAAIGDAQSSTVIVWGFPENATDREVEGLVRYIPGFVAAKLNIVKGRPQLFVRFSDYQHALSAAESMHGTPMDPYAPEQVITVSVARSDLDPAKLRARNGATPIGQLVNGGGKGGGGGGTEVKRTFGASFPTETPSFGKKAKLTPDVGGGTDTLAIFKLSTTGQTADSIHAFFCDLETYEGLRQGGDNLFLKFANHAATKEAMEGAAQVGIKCFPANTSLSMNKATHTKEATVGAPPAFSKKPMNTTSEANGASTDTLAIFKLSTTEQTADSIHAFFCDLETYEGLRQGGDTLFLKFANHAATKEAMEGAAQVGIKCFPANTSLNLSKATHLRETPAC